MGRAMLRILQITLTVVGGLVIVPVAVNVGTGADVPGWLRPYANWLWPTAIACVALVIALETRDKLRTSRVTISTRHPHDPHNRQLALAQVARYVEGRQRGSLGERVRLALNERPEAVRQPAHLIQRMSGEEFQLSAALTIADVFDQMSESMLILGAPGAGKTTQLLDLAAALVTRAEAVILAGAARPSSAEAGDGPAIPVVLDLADWSRSRSRTRRRFPLFGTAERGPRDLTAWLLTSLRERYRIPEKIGEAWLRENQLMLLLDGLDEVREADQERCVAEINGLQAWWGVTRLAVCSREADYTRLAGRLRLQGAVVIRPLTRDQINAYLTAVNPRLAGVAFALSADEELWELLTTPLMLNIMVLAQGDRTWRALSAQGDPAARRRLLFDAYVVEVLARRRAHETGGPERTLRAIRTLAAASVRFDTGVQVVRLGFDSAEYVLDNSVRNVVNTWLFPTACAICLLASVVAISSRTSAVAGLVITAIGLLLLWSASLERDTGEAMVANHLALLGFLVIVATSTVGLILALMWLLGSPRTSSPATAVIAGLGVALALAVLQAVDETDLLMRRVMVVLVATSAAVAAFRFLLGGAPPAALHGWAVGLGGGIFLCICICLKELTSSASSDSDATMSRVLGMQIVLYAIAGIIGSIAFARSWSTPFWLPFIGWVVGITYAILPGGGAGYVLASPFVRMAMMVAGEPVPWRAAFLRFATDRSLLTFTDGEYRFIHLLIRDHLAQCDPTQLAPAVLRRRAELTSPVPGRGARTG